MAHPLWSATTHDGLTRERHGGAGDRGSAGRLTGAASRRVIIVSNRLPFSVVEDQDDMMLRPSSGGLATALSRVHAQTRGLWIGTADWGELRSASEKQVRKQLAAARLAPLHLSELETTGFYRLYSNGILWPSLHGLEPPSSSDRCGWGMYRAVNERFADAVASRWRPGDTVWVHDYQLMLVPRLLRERVPQARIGFFLHTPLPSPIELDGLVDWPELAHGLLGADLVGFQTHRDASHFTEWAGGDADDVRSDGHIETDGRTVRVAACPIGVDAAFFEGYSRHPAVLAKSAALRAKSAGPVFVGVDRLDYTKGIAERLLAFERLLESDPGLHGRARFIQVAVPSREDVHGYRALRSRIETVVRGINARHGTPNWTPVEYMYASVDVASLVALYRAADVMVVTPKRDGMNLVAKEFVAARTDGGGALVLSHGAGAASELRSALLVDGGDIASIAEGYQKALRMPAMEARARMQRLRAAVDSRSVFDWASDFLYAMERPGESTESDER